MRRLYLTSPHMKGLDVRHAQKLLKDNRFDNFHPGAIDGDYGPHSAGATKRAKHWLGFPQKKVNHVYNEDLNKYLKGEPLPRWYKIRRKRRIAASVHLREKALKIAKTQLGISESPPGSNKVKYSAWYGMTGPWCAMFVSWCYVQAGSKKFVRGQRYAYTPYLQYAIRHGWYLFRELHASEVKPGDIVLYDWNGNGVPDHVGIFERWESYRNGTFFAIEGNTALGNDSDGGAVERRYRNTSYVSCFGRQEN